VDEVLAVGDAEFQRKCLGKMSDVAQEGRTVLFVSHNMSAILRLTQEAIVLDHGQMIYRAPSSQAVDYYLSSGFAQIGERVWADDEIPPEAAPFKPIAISIRNPQGQISETVRSIEPFTIEAEYQLAEPITELRLGIYLMTTHGELVFTSFDTDDAAIYEQHSTRAAGHHVSRCTIPGDFLNEGRYVVGINASTFHIKRYFQDEHALSFNVDGAGAPGMQWSENRMGAIRPRLAWKIVEAKG
jgi:lipopolysaccharide transport system ATP-binding protein